MYAYFENEDKLKLLVLKEYRVIQKMELLYTVLILHL